MGVRYCLFVALLTAFFVRGESSCVAEEAGPAAIEDWAVTLIDGATKQPLAAIVVEVQASRAGRKDLASMMLVSDENGVVRVPLAAGQSTFLYVRGPGWWIGGLPVIGEYDFDHDGKPDGPGRLDAHPVLLWRGTEVRGTLLTPEGTPASGVALRAGVYIYNEVWKERLGWETNIIQTWDHGDWANCETNGKTREDGSFSITVPPDDARNWVRVGTSGMDFQAIDTEAIGRTNKEHALVRYAPFEVEVNGWQHNRRVPEQNGVLDLGTLQLEHGIVLMGRVVDADSRPLANVHLLTSSRHGPYAGRKTVSQADGTFEFAPMSPGTFTLTPEATLRDAEGNKRSRDVQAVFVQQEVMLAETDDVVELTVQAVPHVELEFEWVDRRAVKGQSVSYYGEFAVDGRMPREGAKPVWWRGVTEKVARDGKEFLVVKVPREAIELTLTLPADQRVTASYADGETKSGPGRVPLGDVTQAKRRVIYGDEPRAGQ